MSAGGYHIVIPARMASQRLPGKPLVPIAGKPMIEHVYGCALQASAATICIATDDERVFAAARAFGADAVMTDQDLPTGTDRVAACARMRGWAGDAVVVNLQGDEPLMPPECLDQVANLLLRDDRAAMSSLWWPLESTGEIADPNVVKVVTAGDGAALYFSRSVIPYPRSDGGIEAALAGREELFKRHVGLYGYRVDTLKKFAARRPSKLEEAERLEQLRVLEWGGRIVLDRACTHIPAGVDTEADLKRVRNIIT